MINRKEVYSKYNGKCAYCGCDISIKEMQIDHLIPLYRNDSDEQLNEWGKIRGTDDISNLMPSCRSCNHYKSTMDLELFREQLMLLRARLNTFHKIYSISKRYGLIDEKPNEIVFHFEKPIRVIDLPMSEMQKGMLEEQKSKKTLTCYLGNDMSN